MIRAIAGHMDCRRYCYQKLGAIIAGSLYHAVKCVDKVLYRSLPHRVRNLMCTLIGLARTLGDVARIGVCALELGLDRYGACIYHEIMECHSCIESRHKFPLMSIDSFPEFHSRSFARSLLSNPIYPLFRPLYYGMRKPRTPGCKIQV
jgi:hypothetical protein